MEVVNKPFAGRNALMKTLETAVTDIWFELLSEFSGRFTGPGYSKFVCLTSGSVLAERRPLVTEIVTAASMENNWRAVEWFMENGRWPEDQIEHKLSAKASVHCKFKGRNIWALDDTKVYKTGKKIWGTCSYHEYTSRCSNRPETVWGHNWVICGGLSRGEGQMFLPTCARLYMRESQMPDGETFRKKPEMAVELLRLCATESDGADLAVFDGAYAVRSVVRPLLSPPIEEPRVDFLTRLRIDSKLHQEPPPRRPGKNGRPRKWGKRLAAPAEAENWPSKWQKTTAVIYGKKRPVLYKKVYCQWAPAGDKARVNAFAFKIQGYKNPWYLVCSDLDLCPEDVMEIYAARFCQEDAHRDLKQLCGFGTGQGRLKNVVIRTMQLRLIEMTLLRILSTQLGQIQEERWWPKPPWYRQKKRGSLRDVKHLLKEALRDFSRFDLESSNIGKVDGEAANEAYGGKKAA